MHISSTQRLGASLFAIALVGSVPPAKAETGNTCIHAASGLQRHLASNEASQRLHLLREGIIEAATHSGHTPRELVDELLANPTALADPATVRRSLPPDATPLEIPPHAEAPLPTIISRLNRIHEQLDIALAGITDEQADRLHALLPDLLDRTSSGSDLEELEHGPILAKVQAAIDQPALEAATALLAGLAQPELAATLADHYRDAPIRPAPTWMDAHVSGSIIHAEQTAHGAIFVGGPGNNVYSGPAAVIIDIGGEDIYALPAGNRVRIIIDLEGNDSYTGYGDATLAGSVLGASLIADHDGNDTYAGGRISQGAAVAGIGMLHDLAGNDRYHAAELAQGAALAGIGALVDAAGDDLYTAAKFAQGFGGALGVGVLVDESGNDIYLAGNKHASSYGVVGNYQAFSQGVGMGFRNDIAGGVGMLLDRGGNDRYTAGNYSQGTGYYLGAGTLIDEKGDDAYAGGRYTQGAAAHLGIGLLRDEAGNDSYSGSTSASQGAAWDLAIAAFVDCAGDDDYTAHEFALGAAAQNAIAFFVDIEGENRFAAARDAQGHSGPVDYHDGGKRIGNLAVFISQEQKRIDANRGSRVHRRSSIEFGRDRIPLPQNTGVRDAGPGGEHLDARSESGMTEKDGPGTAEKEGPGMTEKTTVIPNWMTERSRARRKEQPSFPARPGIQPNDHR